jgi:hypothetical protein
MKKTVFALVFAFPMFFNNMAVAQGYEDPTFGEPTLRKQYCNARKTTYACKYLSEGENCDLTHTTNCS